MEKTGLRLATKSDLCPSCGAVNLWQLVEQVQQWHHGRYIPGKGFIFEGNREWDKVGDEGEALFLECRSCLSAFEVPDYEWE